MERERFLRILECMNNTCREVNEEILRETPDSKVIYEVLQFSDIARNWNSVHRIADFYNYNWQGNIDFMHIPDFRQVLDNCLNYPIIIAREEGKDDILAISTIKYDENLEGQIDPYFPEENAKYFSITGILAKRETEHRGMGKKIYEIAIRGVHGYHKEYPDTRIMCVIDCRNKNSLRALSSAVEKINEKGIYGENKELPANIVGYYELQNLENESLSEAPTLVLEVGLNERERMVKEEEKVISYQQEDGEELFQSLKNELREKFMKYGIENPIVNQDGDLGIVYYYSLDREYGLQGTEIISNGTEKGNDRIPVYDEYMHDFIGPVQSIFVEEEEYER